MFEVTTHFSGFHHHMSEQQAPVSLAWLLAVVYSDRCQRPPPPLVSLSIRQQLGGGADGENIVHPCDHVSETTCILMCRQLDTEHDFAMGTTYSCCQ